MLNSILSLLQKVSASQIDDLIFEHDLSNDGYNFYYTIDCYDLHKYCFPGDFFGDGFERDEHGKINIDLETDRATAYDHFFSMSKDQPVILLPEYLTELLSLRDLITVQLTRGELFNYAATFMDYFNNPSKAGTKEDFTLFISIATGMLHDGAQRFNRVLRHKNFLAINDDNLDELSDSEFLRNMLSCPENKDLQDVVFKAFLQPNRKARLVSKHVDSAAIARVITMNNEAIKGVEGKRSLFLFLSSADSTIDVINGITQHLPEIEKFPNQRFNFHRTVEQLFLDRLFETLGYHDKKDRLKNARLLVAQREQQVNLDEKLELEIAASMIDFSEIRQRYVNVNLARNFAKIDELQSNLNGTNFNYKKLRSFYLKLKKTAEEFADVDKNIEYIQELENVFQIGQVVNIAFRTAVSQLIKTKTFKISTGKDNIQGAAQHLPVVFKYDKAPISGYLNAIAELYLNNVALLENKSESETMIKHLTEVGEKISNKNIRDISLEEKLVYCLYLLVLPDYQGKGRISNTELVIQFLEDLMNREVDKSDPIIYADFIYTASWVFRRNIQYDEASRLAEEGITAFPDDPRFYHSRFLINACRKIDDYRCILDDIIMATDLYRPFLHGKTQIIRDNIIGAMLNSFLYIRTMQLNSENIAKGLKWDTLQALRQKYLLPLKELLGRRYFKYPEYLHTEGYFLLSESKDAPDLHTTQSKLSEAKQTCNVGELEASKLINYNVAAFVGLKGDILKAEKAFALPTTQ